MSFTDQQKLAIDKLDSSMCISAGAGSGKTRVLVERFWSILQKGENVESILAVTFTRKAAGEMVERIRDRVEVSSLDYTRKNQIKEKLSGAWIGTIHSLCARILRENPVEGGVDPYFSIIDDLQAFTIKSRIARQVILDALNKNDSGVLPYLTEYGFKQLLNDLIGLYNVTSNRGLSLRDMEKITFDSLQQEEAELSSLVQKTKTALSLAIASKNLVGTKTKAYQKLCVIEAKEKDWVKELEQITISGHGESHYRLCEEILDLCKGNNGKAGEALKELKQEVDNLLGCLSELDTRPHLKTLFELSNILQQEVNEYKIKENLLEYNDLEERVLSLFEQYPAILKYYSEQFKYIMVDEFQDTNYRQVELVKLLSGSQSLDKLFLVGDPKQSIYRFRGAQVKLFDMMNDKVSGAGGISHYLNKNFRTRSTIINFINDTFDKLMQNTDNTFQELSWWRQYNGNNIELHLIKKDKNAELAHNEAEARCIAERIKKMVDEQEMLVSGTDSKGKECNCPVTYADIALLFATANSFDVYAAVFAEYGIPYYVEGSRDFFQAQEIKALILALQVINNADDELSLAGVLRSPVFGVSDETLWLLKQKGYNLEQAIEKAEIFNLKPDERNRVIFAHQVINELRELKYFLSVRELIDLLLEKTQYEYLLAAQPNFRQKLANIVKFKQMADNLQDNQVLSVGEFLNYIKQAHVAGIKEEQAFTETEKGNTVKLMTVHKSKGLEFPVVILPEINHKFNLQDIREAVLVCDELGVYLKGRYKGKLRKEAEEIERNDLINEYMRLFYVATTRTRDYLIMSGYYDTNTEGEIKAEKDSWLAWLLELCEIKDELSEQEFINRGINPFVYEQKNFIYSHDISGEQQDKVSSIGLELFKPVTEGINTEYPQYISASRMIAYNYCPFRAYLEYTEEIKGSYFKNETGVKREIKATDLGTIIHKAIEVADTLREAELLLEEMLGQDISQDIREKAYNMVKNYYENETVNSLNSTKKLQKEVQFLSRVNPGMYFRGYVDQLWIDDNDLYIMDIKTGKEKDESYALQLNIYEKALRQVFEADSAKKALFYLPDNKIVEIGEAELPEKIDLSPQPVYTEKCDICIYKRLCFPAK